MKSILTLTVLLITLTGCESLKTKAGETGGAELNKTVAKPYQTAEKHYQGGRLKQAKQGFETVLKRDPGNIEAHFRLGNIALRDNQLEPAKLHYQAILELDRRHAKSHYNLGVIYLMQAERYFQYFTATTTQNNNSPRLLKLLENINQFSADPEEAKIGEAKRGETEIQTDKQLEATKPVETSLDRLTDLLSDDTAK